MLKMHVNNLEERKISFLNKYQTYEPQFHKSHYVIEVLSSYEVFVYIVYLDNNDVEDVLPKFSIDRKSIQSILNTNIYANEKKIYSFEEENINVVMTKDKVSYVFNNFIGDKVEKEFLNFFKEEFPVFINVSGDFQIEMFGEGKNMFLFKEFQYYLSKFNIPYGFVMFFIKEKIDLINKYLDVNNISKLENNNINIHNSIREMMSKKQKKRWRSNKKIHVLNIHNIEMLDKNDIYLYNEKYYIKYKNIIYNIKEFYEMKRKNIIKIKEKYNRSNEIIYSYKFNEKRYIVKVTKSISKSLYKHLQIVDFDDHLNNFLLKDNDEEENYE